MNGYEYFNFWSYTLAFATIALGVIGALYFEGAFAVCGSLIAGFVLAIPVGAIGAGILMHVTGRRH